MDQRRKHIANFLAVVTLLYLFLLSIKLLGISFNLFGGDFAERLVCSCSNPFVGLFIGILTTAIVQSSSMTTSLTVALTGSGVLPLEYAIPIIMGANIGTSITNLIVSLTFVTRKLEFKRAFAGAVVHDFFNIFTVLVFFPIELNFHLIQKLALSLTRVFEGAGGANITSPLGVILDPAADAIEGLLAGVLGFHDITAGIILLIFSLGIMFSALLFLVKVMKSLIIGRTEVFINRFLFRNDGIAFLLGLLLTSIVQSSSITTSLIVPLVASGVITLNRCYPYTLGANIGTTITAILASLATVSAVSGQAVNTIGVTTAFAHLTFNILGVSVFYPLKRIPIFCASSLAELAAESKRWAIVFMLGLFFVVPIIIIVFTN
ncbi:MAG: Na/Pi symporter [Candidatus Krumholzibacteria bacterium]|nr:Na/Pi symporter [Candidatus Krumholzibacteria bacterium]